MDTSTRILGVGAAAKSTQSLAMCGPLCHHFPPLEFSVLLFSGCMCAQGYAHLATYNWIHDYQTCSMLASIDFQSIGRVGMIHWLGRALGHSRCKTHFIAALCDPAHTSSEQMNVMHCFKGTCPCCCICSRHYNVTPITRCMSGLDSTLCLGPASEPEML